jgi:ribose transport system permease protein
MTVAPALTRAPSSALTAFVVASRYMPVYLALMLLWIAASIWAPNMLSSNALAALAPYAALLGITALGQMLVIMTGGIDLSTPGTFTLGALLMVGVGQQNDSRIATALITVVAVAAVIGLANGVLIGGLRLNPLITTLAVGSIMVALAFRYTRGFPVQRPVPTGWSSWTSSRVFGLSPVFWTGAILTVALILIFRYTTLGRRFQVAGANPMAAQVVGVRFRVYQTFVYVVAAVLYGLSGAALAGLLRTPGMGVGDAYLLGPIAAVVIGGAALTGGLASPAATFAAALFLTGLNQMMQVMRLPTSLQFVVFGLVIIGGMLVSGDRIIKGVERVLRERRRPKRTESSTLTDSSTTGKG